jgi:recombination protein RecR
MNSNKFAEPCDELIALLANFPGIGQKSAQRIVSFLIQQPEEVVKRIAHLIELLKSELKTCKVCHNLSRHQICKICADTKRFKDTVCVVEYPKDLWAIENTGIYRGVYHVLNGVIAPLDGITPDKLTIKNLLERVRQGAIKEIILATNPTAEGDATAHYIYEKLKQFNIKITRISRGIPTGSGIEFVNKAILSDAIQYRTNYH